MAASLDVDGSTGYDPSWRVEAGRLRTTLALPYPSLVVSTWPRLPTHTGGMTTIADFNATLLTGEDQPLSEYLGQVVLVVNTASKCGLTPQFEGLEALYREFGEEGLAVLGFPCNQFAGQEPGTATEIGQFCELNYGVTFPMFARIEVNGAGTHPLWAWLKSEGRGLVTDSIKWNFTKFLIGRDGAVVRRYAPTVEPADLAADIRSALA